MLQVTISADGSTFTIVGIATTGFTTGPGGVGTYAITGTIVNLGYSGSGTGTLTISQATPVVTWNAPGGDHLWHWPWDPASWTRRPMSPAPSPTRSPPALVLGVGASQALSVVFTPGWTPPTHASVSAGDDDQRVPGDGHRPALEPGPDVFRARKR